MAWTKVNDYTPSVSDIESLQETVDVQRRGYDFVTLTNWSAGNTTVPAVEVGSVIEINGSVFELDTSNLTIGTVPGGATNNLYIKLTVSGGTTVTADWSTTVPTWDAAKGGWFSGSDKFLPFIVDYDGASTWDNKREIISRYNKNLLLLAGGAIAPSGIEAKIYFYDNSNPTEDEIFDALTPANLEIGKYYIFNGGATYQGNPTPNWQVVFSHIYRTSSTQYSIYGTQMADDGSSGGFIDTITDGSSSVWPTNPNNVSNVSFSV